MNDLNFAIQMEIDGEKYYRQQAELNKDNSLYAVCLMLADDEKNHARILKDKLATGKCQLIDSDTLAQAKNVFSGLRDLHSDVKAHLNQLDFYRLALEKEQQSIDLYEGYLGLADGPLEKELFEFLIKQEKHHYEVLDELVTLLAHAEEWVENAEFGRRKEY